MKLENVQIGFFGYARPNGTVTAIQSVNAIEPFRLLLSQERPSQVLEIGTARAGLTLIIRDLLDETGLNETPIHTYDTACDGEPLQKDIQSGAKIKFFSENMFNSVYDDLINELDPNGLPPFIQRPGVSLVLCDGGCKKCEVNVLSKFLKPGDIIMAHDYAPNASYFEDNINGKIWNWHEIQDSDVQSAVENYSLQPCLQDEFLKGVWMCKKKYN